MLLSPRCATLGITRATLGATLLLVLVGAPVAHAEQAMADGPPFLVNTVTDGTQDVPDVSTVGSGFVIVWENSGPPIYLSH